MAKIHAYVHMLAALRKHTNGTLPCSKTFMAARGSHARASASSYDTVGFLAKLADLYRAARIPNSISGHVEATSVPVLCSLRCSPSLLIHKRRPRGGPLAEDPLR